MQTNKMLNNLRHRKIKDMYLITTDQGSWVGLNEKKFKDLLRNKTDAKLNNLLEKKGLILTEENLPIVVDDYRQKCAGAFRGTSLHIILPTLRCNQKCLYCHSSAAEQSKKNADMTKDIAKKTLEFIFQSPAEAMSIEFQGGDTLLNPTIFRFIVTEAKKMAEVLPKKIRFALVTNLTCYTEDLLNFISKEKIEVCTSLDGPKELHNKNRIYEGGKPTYNDVIKGIRECKKKGIPVGAIMVTTKDSLNMHKEIVDEYVKHGFKSLQIKYINKLGFAEKTWGKIGYSVEEFIEFWKKSVDYMIELNKKGKKIKSRYAVIILEKILKKKDPCFAELMSPCGAIIGQMAYNFNGDIYSCDEGRNYEIFKIGNVTKDTYEKVIHSKQTKQIITASINDNLLCDNCAYKSYCGVCPVIAYAEENNLIPKLSKFSKCKISKAQFDYIFEKLFFDQDAKKILLDWVNN